MKAMNIGPRALTHVYWVGGSPCSGKSSIVDALVATHELQIYRADEAYFRHAQIVTPEEQPIFYKLTHTNAEELWMRPVEQQVAEEIMLYREEAALILADLLALPKATPILAEGAALLPEYVVPFLREPHRAIWIVPTAAFQREHYAKRAWAHDVVSACTNPEQAFEHWMQRDIGFAQFVEREALRYGMRVLVVNGMHSLAENTTVVQQYFRLDKAG